MRRNLCRILAALLLSVIVFSIVPMRVSANITTLAAQINAIDGLFADAGTNTITVTGTNENITTPLSLTIDSGITVNWEATYTGAVSPASASMITVGGSGTFNIRNSGSIINIGTGNTLNITGASTSVRIYNNGTVQSSRSGNAILISTDYVEVDVGLIGSVISLDGNASAAIQIGGGSVTLGTVININNGSVISIGAGFAINDGAGTALLNNDTEIRITGGVVTAGGNSAIHSTGIRSTVVISGGIISNAAGNNLNPAIDMQGDMATVTPSPVYNITVGGSAIIQSTSTSGYAVQTKGNVLVQADAHIAAINGRAINLVGLDSTALIQGGLVETAGSGAAISTATTNVDTVVRASIEVTGGTVTSVNGYAINATGANSNVIVSGGSVTTKSAANNAINATGAGAAIAISGDAEVSAIGGDAIHTTATAANAVTVGGSAKISSVTGRAIYASGAGSGVTVNDTCQIWVWNTGNAIYCRSGTVTLNSGFVFAYGSGTANVINASSVSVPPGSRALIVTWYKRVGSDPWIYREGTYVDLYVDIGNYGQIRWENDSVSGSGISYGFYPNVGFFPINELSVYREFGLIFDSNTGKMTQNVDGTGNLVAPNLTPFTEGWEFTWDAKETAPGGPYALILNGFSWISNTTNVSGAVPPALTIVGSPLGPTEIIINGDSSFKSVNPDGGAGIRFGQSIDPGNEIIILTGNSTLTAIGRNSPGIGVDIRNGSLTINSGTFAAQAGRAVNWEPPDTGRVIADPLIFDYSWTFSQNFDGSGGETGYGALDPFVLFESDRFVRFKAVTPINLTSAVQLGGISRIADSVAIELRFDAPVEGLTADDITITNGSGRAVKGILSGSGSTWILTLSSVDAEGTITVEVNQHVGDYFVLSNRRDNVQIYKAETEEFLLTITKTVQPGGDFDRLFEFEILLEDDPRAPRAAQLTTDPSNTDALYVTNRNGSALHAGRITGRDNNILLLKHNEGAIINNLPIGYYVVMEHANSGFITAFNINSEGWFTAPDGLSRRFRLASDTLVECFNSIVPEIPGEPERPFDPENPEIPPNQPDIGDNREKSPQTGITRSPALPVILLILAAAAITGAEVYRRKTAIKRKT